MTLEQHDLIVHDAARLAMGRQRMQDGDPGLRAAAARLRADAESARQGGPFTIVAKTRLPPSGDPHDYMSMGPYWWPDPAKPDGLPYVRRDGEVNPECGGFDRPALDAMTRAVTALSLAWFFLGEAAYASDAVRLLRAFFLDAETRMNPHLEFGQAIPGRCTGRGIGIIETTALAVTLVDAILLLRSSPALKPEDLGGLQGWFGAYLDWLLGSAHGLDEARQKNNHGTAYDLHLAVFSLFVGRDDLAGEVLRAVPERRIATQIEPDGRQPRELTRTKALSYATANLSLLVRLAAVAAKHGTDLWRFETRDGRGIRKALEWLIPFWTGARPWPYQQIAPFHGERALDLLRCAAWAYGEPAYEQAILRLPLPDEERRAARTHLLCPAMTA